MKNHTNSQDPIQPKNRPAAVAGRFYPGSPERLKKEVEKLFAKAQSPFFPGESPRALIAPHAGYVFSGRVAASAYNQIDGSAGFKRVFVIASSHQMQFPGASLWTTGDYETPLGSVTVDQETCRALRESSPLFQYREEAHLNEHSLEVQLPFLQVKLGNGFRLVPIIVGTGHADDCSLLANVLRPYFLPENLFVVSSDLSHYPCYDDAVTTDKITTEAILSNSPDHLLLALKNNRAKEIAGLATSLCGWTSVLTLLYLTREYPFQTRWIDYQNSGDEPHYGDHERVVGYSSVAFFPNPESSLSLSRDEKKVLFDMAECAIRETVCTGKPFPQRKEPPAGNLDIRTGAFVSIYIDGKLRGCIGSFSAEEPLWQLIPRLAVSAASDNRFDRPEPEELDGLSIEISLLTPLRRIHSAGEIIPGKHGIYLKKGWASGTFLPQVAAKYGWDREELLGRCSRDKAGLGWDGWKTAELYVYEAVIFRNTPEGENPSSCNKYNQ